MDELSLQEQEFVKEVALTGNQTQAVKKVYGIKNEGYARVKGTRLITKDNINTAVQEVKRSIAEQLTGEMLVEKHLELLNQKQINYFVFPKTMTDEEIIGHVNANGIEVITVRESDKGKMAFYSMPDAQAIKSGLDMAYKLKGEYATDPDKTTNILMPVLVKFLNKKDDESSDSRNTD